MRTGIYLIMKNTIGTRSFFLHVYTERTYTYVTQLRPPPLPLLLLLTFTMYEYVGGEKVRRHKVLKSAISLLLETRGPFQGIHMHRPWRGRHILWRGRQRLLLITCSLHICILHTRTHASVSPTMYRVPGSNCHKESYCLAAGGRGMDSLS